MLFNIEQDQGHRITGYVVPDSFSTSACVRLSDGERELLVHPCEEERPALVTAGRHATGRCGFSIDDALIPDLAGYSALELHEPESGILIYRRRSPVQAVQQRIFRLETQLVPLWRLDDSLDAWFQFCHKSIERRGRETATQIFLLNNARSQYVSGRLVFKSYENYLADTFTCVVMLRDPYLELAERLLALKQIRKVGGQFLGERDLISYGPAIEFSEALGDDPRALRRAFAAMPTPAIAALANPLTRQLAARNIEEIPARGPVATALATLSTFSIIGLREQEDLFLTQLAELIGVERGELPTSAQFNTANELAAMLRQVPEVEILIEQDLEVYHTLTSAIQSVLAE